MSLMDGKVSIFERKTHFCVPGKEFKGGSEIDSQ
jgi:hypothetical protein